MQRKELLNKLESVSPALSDNDLIPVLTHFWFTGDKLLAYNDQIAMSTDFVAPFKGAVPGQVFLSLLKASTALDIETEVADAILSMNLRSKSDPSASSKLKLSLLPEEEFQDFFTMREKGEEAFPIKSREKFLAAIELCMRSIGTDTSVPDKLGLTLIPQGKELMIYATDGATLSHAVVALNASVKSQRVILPANFCKQLLRLGKAVKDSDFHFEVHDDHALLVVPGVSLFGRVIETDHPLDYVKVIEKNYPVGMEDQLISIPPRMRLILERQIVITDSASDQGATTISITGDKKGSRMKFSSKTPRGEAYDTITADPHPEVACRVYPRLLKAGWGDFDKMTVTKNCVVMARGSMLYMVSAASST